MPRSATTAWEPLRRCLGTVFEKGLAGLQQKVWDRVWGGVGDSVWSRVRQRVLGQGLLWCLGPAWDRFAMGGPRQGVGWIGDWDHAEVWDQGMETCLAMFVGRMLGARFVVGPETCFCICSELATSFWIGTGLGQRCGATITEPLRWGWIVDWSDAYHPNVYCKWSVWLMARPAFYIMLILTICLPLFVAANPVCMQTETSSGGSVQHVAMAC